MKRTFGIFASLALAILSAGALSSCEKAAPNEASAVATPANEVDGMLNDYEKVAMQIRKLARKLKGGDVSVTSLYIDAGQEFRQWPAKHQQLWAKMTPQQAQRAAGISARTAPYLPK